MYASEALMESVGGLRESGGGGGRQAAWHASNAAHGATRVDSSHVTGFVFYDL
jgi:hypothetical protein